jgi:hypothetical protein
MLGNWEAAYKDFCKAQLSDFDEDVQTWCKEVEANVYLFLFSFPDLMCRLSRLRRLLNINVNMIDSEKQKKLMLNENVFAKLKKLMLKHSKKKMNDEHENNNLVLQVVVNFQDFRVYPYNVQPFHVSYIFFFIQVVWVEWVEWAEWAEWVVELI